MSYRGVLVDLFPGLFPGGGIGRYVRDVAAALQTRPGAPPARLAYPRPWRADVRGRYPHEMLYEIPMGWRALRARFVAGAWLGWGADRLYGEPAVFHSPLGHGPIFRRARLIAHVHDLTFLEHPEWHPFRTSFFYRQTIPAAVRHATVVLCHSHFVRQRVVRVFGVAPERAITIHPPLGHGFRAVSHDQAVRHTRSRFGLEGDFVLHVGTLEPRKNHIGLVAAFERLRRAGFRGPLVLVGQDGWRIAPILACLEQSAERNAIRRIRDANDEDLAALYGACTFLAFPSLEEGFGMPLLEAMACGAASVSGDHPTLVELAEGRALFVPAADADALAEAMIRLWRDPDLRARLAAGGPERAAGYAFDLWAEKTFSLYRSELRAAGVAIDGDASRAAS